MNNQEWLIQYNKLNNSFKKKLVFRIGTDAGFFSEYNNMIFAMLYCLQNEIKFVLSSKDNKFSIEKGWQDFFLPFTEETLVSFHVRHNNRGWYYNPTRREYYKIRILRKLFSIDFLTQDLWCYFREPEFWKSKFSIPKLGISNCNLLEGSRIIVNNIWNYQPDVQDIINYKKASIGLPKEYIGVHMRSGDKVTEHKLFSVEDYMLKVEQVSSCKNIYIATDDYANIVALKKYKGYNIYTVCQEKSTGHVQSEFDSLNTSSKKEAILDLLADIDALSNSLAFIGTYSSNIGMYLGMKMGEENCHCLDFESWRVW